MTNLGRQVSEDKFLRWLVTFQGLIKYSADSQTMLCGIRLDVDKSGNYTGMMYIKLRSVGIRTLVETFFDEAISPFSPDSRIRVRQPSRPMQYEARKSYIKGGARFETDVYRAC